MFDHDIVVLFVRPGVGCSTYRRKAIVKLVKKAGFHVLPQDDEDEDQVVTRPVFARRLPWETYEEATEAIALAAGGAVECEWQCYDEVGTMEFAHNPAPK